MSASEVLITEFDAPWKASLEWFLEPFLAPCFPQVRALKLFRLIEWLTRLPREWELRFREELIKFEKTENPMTELLSTIELMALEKGRQEGRQEGWLAGRRGDILEALEMRFGSVPEEVRKKVDDLWEEEALRRALRAAITATSAQSFLEQI